MLKLNRTTEYGLIAISYIRNKQNTAVQTASVPTSSAREIAEHFNLPFEILAKTLQKLKERGVISSTYGTRGGYVLARDLVSLNLAEFVNMMEGPVAVVNCANPAESSDPTSKSVHGECEYSTRCNIKGPMQELNSRIYEFLHRISIEELTRKQAPATMTTRIAHELPTPAYGEEP